MSILIWVVCIGKRLVQVKVVCVRSPSGFCSGRVVCARAGSALESQHSDQGEYGHVVADCDVNAVQPNSRLPDVDAPGIKENALDYKSQQLQVQNLRSLERDP